MASNQGEEPGDQNQNQNQDQGQNQEQNYDEQQNRTTPWCRITPVLIQNLVPRLPNPPAAVRSIVDRSQRTEPYQILEDEIPRPANAVNEGEVEAYAEGYEPSAGKDAADKTDWVHGQTYAHEKNLPRVLRLMLMARTHEEYKERREPKMARIRRKDKDKRVDLTDESGNTVSVPVKKKGGVTNITIKENPILPRHISSEVEGWRILMWMQYDPDIKLRDIHARIRTRFRTKSNDGDGKKGKKANEDKKSKENEGEVYTYLTQKVSRWMTSAKGGQFSIEERQNKKQVGEPSRKDVETAKNQFDPGPEAVNDDDDDDDDDDDKVAYFNSMAREGGLNKIYWNTPWAIFRHEDENGKLEILVQQPGAMVKDVYFRADEFNSDPQERERVYHALWKSYFPARKRFNENRPLDDTKQPDDNHQQLDEYQQRDYSLILSFMRRLELEYSDIQEQVLERENEDYEGPLDFTGKYVISRASINLLGFVNHLRDYGMVMGLNNRFELEGLFEIERQGTIIKLGKVQDLNTYPMRVAARVLNTIASLYAEMHQVLLSWDRVTTTTSTFVSMERGNNGSETNSYLEIEPTTKSAVILALRKQLELASNEAADEFEEFKSRWTDEGEDFLKRKNYVMQNVLGRFLSAIRAQAEYLEVSNVYYLKPFAPDIGAKDKCSKLAECLLTVKSILLHELRKYPNVEITEYYTENEQRAFSDQLSQESLADFVRKKRELEHKSRMSERSKGKNSKDGEPYGIGTGRRTRAVARSGISLDTGSNTVKLPPLRSEIGHTPIDPYDKNPPFSELFDQHRLNGELDRVLGAHKKSVAFPQDRATFFQRLHHVLAQAKFEDVLGHLRISKPVIEFLSDPDRSDQDHADFQDALTIARDVDRALVNARYRRTSLDTTSEDGDYRAFFQRVVYVLDLNDQNWARSVREKTGVFKTTEADSAKAHGIGESPTKIYSDVRSKDMFDQERLRRDIRDVLAAHGRHDEIPGPQKSACDLMRHVLETVDFADLLGHFRIGNPVLYMLRNTNAKNSEEVYRLARVVDAAMERAKIIEEPSVSAALSGKANALAVADELQQALVAWVARVRRKLKPEPNATGASTSSSGSSSSGPRRQRQLTQQQQQQRQSFTPMTPDVGSSPVERGGYGDLYQQDGTTLDRARFNQELDRVLRSHEYTATFDDGEGFEDRIVRVLQAPFADVLGHHRIAAPVMHMLRTAVDADATQRLALAVDTALQDAGYTAASLNTPDLEEQDDDDDAAYFHKVAGHLRDALPLWSAAVRFTLQNYADYALVHPDEPRPKDFQKLFETLDDDSK